jgi:hypothetical protein
MLVALLLCALLLAGCQTSDGEPAAAQAAGIKTQSQLSDTNETSRDNQVDAGAIVPVQLSPGEADMATSLLRDALKADGAAAATALALIARLPAEKASLFAGQIDVDTDSQTEPTRQQLAAWLTVDPASAVKFLESGLSAGRAECYMALAHNPEAGRPLLARLELEPGDTKHGALSLDLLRVWGGAEPGDAVLLRQLLGSEDPAVKYRAAGHLLALGEGGDAEFELLRSAVRARSVGWVGAIEGIKISGDGRFADVLVPLASQAELAEDGLASAEPEEEFSESSAVRMAAYALAYLPGEQAALVRGKLLDGRSQRVRWHARLGELLHGNPAPWHGAVTNEGIDALELWAVLAPPEARHRELLPLYAAAAYSEDSLLRARAAAQLNRYNDTASSNKVARILARLVAGGRDGGGWNDNELQAARYQALVTAGELGLPHIVKLAREIMNKSEDSSPPGLAAAFYLLAVGHLPGAGAGAYEKGSDG